VCHQTVSLIARHLEAIGIPTLCMGSALDIMEAGKAPRAVFTDYPLGHTTGMPGDPGDQYAVTRAGLEAFETIREPGTILKLDRAWTLDPDWKADTLDDSKGDQRSPRDETPRYQLEEDRIAAEGA
jgi:D-proline reductase (dithiol) PrdB